VDRVPVAHQSEDQQGECDQQQPGRFRRVHRMPVMLVRRFILWGLGGHADIVAPRANQDSEGLKSEVRGLFQC